MDSFLSILDSIPEDSIAVTVYLLGSLLILWCWYSIATRLPKLLGGTTWIMIFAILLTPTVSEGPNASIAPAIFGLLFGMLTKESALIWSNLSLILFVMGAGFMMSFFWAKYTARQTKALDRKTHSPL